MPNYGKELCSYIVPSCDIKILLSEIDGSKYCHSMSLYYGPSHVFRFCKEEIVGKYVIWEPYIVYFLEKLSSA